MPSKYPSKDEYEAYKARLAKYPMGKVIDEICRFNCLSTVEWDAILRSLEDEERFAKSERIEKAFSDAGDRLKEAQGKYNEWLHRMASLHGDGHSFKLGALSDSELKEGAPLERDYLAANKAFKKALEASMKNDEEEAKWYQDGNH